MADGLTVGDATRASSAGEGGAGRRRARRALVVRYRLTPWWARVLVVFVASRVVSTALLLGFARVQGPNAWTLPSPDYASFATIWDGHWYYIISAVGYPTTLPITSTGNVGESAWAFMPVYPFTVRALTELTGVPFAPLAVFVSVLCAVGTALLLYRLMRHVLPEGTALFTVALFCFSPLSPLLQVAYAESMFLLLLCACLLLLVRRQYLPMLPLVAALSFTRPGALALALAIGLHAVHRWSTRARDPFPRREMIAVSVSAVTTAVLGFGWLIVAGVVTGRPDAYTATELAWRAPYVGYGPLVPFSAWFEGAAFWSRMSGGFPVGAVFVLAVLGLAVLLLGPWGRRIGVDLRLWGVAYALYLLAVFFPQSSTWRLLMPLFPLLGILAVPRSRVWRVGLLLVFVAGQFAWLYYSWWVDGYDWTPP